MDQPIHDGEHRILGGTISTLIGCILVVIYGTISRLSSENPDTWKSHLRKLGFEDLDALDPSGSMLAQARRKNLYSNYICDFLTENTLPEQNGWYDCITTSGGFGQGHIPAEALRDLIRLTKKGGYIILVMREEYITLSCYDGILEPLMKKLEDEQKWRIIQRSVIPEYAFHKPGLLYVFEVS